MPMPRSLGSSQVTFLPSIQIWPAVDVEEAGDGVEQRRLAAARGAEQDDELAVVDIEIEVLEDLEVAEGDAEILDRDFRHRPTP